MTIDFQIETKLYTCPEYHLLVFPTEEATAVAAAVAGAVQTMRIARAAAYYADWLSKELDCHVSFIPVGQVFCVAEIGKEIHGYRQVHVVSGECMGWINVADWLNVEEVKE